MDNKTYISEKYVTLSDGTKMPKIGYGTYLFQGEPLVPFLKEVIKAGYRHIDTAKFYANEAEIGKAMKEVISEGLVKREDVYITTKLRAVHKDDPEKYLRESLKDLQTDYVDLYLIHFPLGVADPDTNLMKQIPLYKTWALMEECVKKGLCKSIGVSNFNVQLILDLLSYAQIKPVVNQVEIHPYLTQEDLTQFCHKYKIQVQAYCPLGRGDATPASGEPKVVLADPVIAALAKKYNKTPAQVVMNWHLSKDLVVLPKTSTATRLKENLEIDNFVMSEEDLKSISQLNCNYRVVDSKYFEGHGFCPIFA
jgi:diketogulonate reductase-like aldo/keto reductase